MTRRAMDFIAEAETRRAAVVPASVLHQAALALYRARALRQHVFGATDILPAVRSQKERQEAHPVFAAYMDMRYSRNMARDEAREKVIPAYMGLITADRRPDGRADALPRGARPARHHDDRVHLRSWRLSRRSLDGREGSVPRAVGEDSADRDRSLAARPTARAARCATRWSRRSISRRPSSIISAARCRITFSKGAR